MSWTADVTPILEYYTERTPGSVMEFKRSCIAWHYRDCDKSHGAWQAKQCIVSLAELGKRLPIMITNGNKSIEVRPNNAVPQNLVDVALQKIEERAIEAATAAATAVGMLHAASVTGLPGGDPSADGAVGGDAKGVVEETDKTIHATAAANDGLAGNRGGDLTETATVAGTEVASSLTSSSEHPSQGNMDCSEFQPAVARVLDFFPSTAVGEIVTEKRWRQIEIEVGQEEDGPLHP